MTDTSVSQTMESWRREAEGATFFGKPIAEMPRSKLLSIIGYLIAAEKAATIRHARELDLMSMIPRVARMTLDSPKG